jgi:hypothetical protein
MDRVSRLNVVALAVALAIAVAGVPACGGNDDTPSTPAIPVQISLSATPASPTEVVLRWSGLSGAPTRYEVYINGAFYASAYPSSASSTSESVRISALTAGTNYCFSVYAVYFPVGVGSRSNDACTTTPKVAG